MSQLSGNRPVALITGVSRRKGIGAAIAIDLARSGWTVATAGWSSYDQAMPHEGAPGDGEDVLAEIREHCPGATRFEADLTDQSKPAWIFDQVNKTHGPVTALILAHCHDEASGILDTSPESYDRHFAINARASWLLIREFGLRYKGAHGAGRIIALTSDHTAGNLPYGASKGALDRMVLAAAFEFKDLGVTANVINPGPTDNGWMNDESRKDLRDRTWLGRLGKPGDCANLAQFLCSDEGGWINGQLLHSNGGFY